MKIPRGEEFQKKTKSGKGISDFCRKEVIMLLNRRVNK